MTGGGKLIRVVPMTVDSVMPPDQQEAESRKYANHGLWLVGPLRSGEWGIFDGSYRIIGTTSGGLPDDTTLRQLVAEYEPRLRREVPRTAAGDEYERDLGIVGSVASPEDLGL